MARGPFSAVPTADERAFDRLRESIDPAWIEAALEATGKLWAMASARSFGMASTAPPSCCSRIVSSRTLTCGCLHQR